MPAASLHQITRMVRDVRRSFARDYGVNMRAASYFACRFNDTRYAVPLNSGGGALYFSFEKRPDLIPLLSGAGCARLELLTRMPKSLDDYLLGEDSETGEAIEALIGIFAGKHNEYQEREYRQYTDVSVDDRMDETRFFDHPLIPLGLDILDRFVQQKTRLPANPPVYEVISPRMSIAA